MPRLRLTKDVFSWEAARWRCVEDVARPPTKLQLFRGTRRLSSQRQRHTLAATNAKGRQAFFSVALDHFVQQRDQHAAA